LKVLLLWATFRFSTLFRTARFGVGVTGGAKPREKDGALVMGRLESVDDVLKVASEAADDKLRRLDTEVLRDGEVNGEP